MKWRIGVDPGNQGGLALLDHNGKAVEYQRMPDIKGMDDFFYTAYVMSQGKIICIFEEQKGGRSSKDGGFTNDAAHKSAGLYLGYFKMLCHVRGIPFHTVTPQEWKGKLGLTARKGENKGLSYQEKRKNAKEKSIEKAKEIFPGINLIPDRCRNEHDGVAEALLIAEWGKRQGL